MSGFFWGCDEVQYIGQKYKVRSQKFAIWVRNTKSVGSCPAHRVAHEQRHDFRHRVAHDPYSSETHSDLMLLMCIINTVL